MTTQEPNYAADAMATNSNEIPLESYLQNRDRATTRRHSSGLAAAAAMTAISRHPSKSEKSPPPLYSANRYYSSRQTPITPPMSPIRASELAMRSPTKSERPSERPYGMAAQLPSPPLNGSEHASQYPTEKKNIIFPKTLRHPPSEPEVPSNEPRPPAHVPLSSRTLREPRPVHQVSQPNATTSSYMHLSTQRAPPPPPQSPPEIQNYSVPPKGHIPLSSKTLRRPSAQQQPQQRNQMSQAPSTTHIPLSSKTLRHPPTERKGSMSTFRTSLRSPQREKPPVGSMQRTVPAPPESIPMKRRTDHENKVDTDVHRTQLPAVTHEHIKPVIHHIKNEEYTREIHNHDYIHRVLPVKDTHILPTKHYAPSPTEPGKLVEIAAPAAPISPAMASHTTCSKDISTNRGSPVDNLPVPAQPQQKSGDGDRRHLVKETTVIAPDGTMRTESVWHYKATTDSAAHDEIEVTPTPPRVNWETEAILAKEDTSYQAQPAQPSTPRKGDVLGSSREREFRAGADVSPAQSSFPGMPRRGMSESPSTENAAAIAANAALEQELRRPSVASEWKQVQKRAAPPGAKPRAGRDKEGVAAGKHFEQARLGKRVSQDFETEPEPVQQRPGRPAPSGLTPSSKAQGTFLSSIMPEKIEREGTPHLPGEYREFEERERGSDYGTPSSAPSPPPDARQAPSPPPDTKQALFKHEAYAPSGKLDSGIWKRHSLVIPAGVVKGGKAVMGPGQLTEGQEKEQELSMHRLKKVSKPEAERVRAHESLPPLAQNQLEAAKLEKHKMEIEREKTEMGNIQRMASLGGDEGRSDAETIAGEKAAEKLREVKLAQNLEMAYEEAVASQEENEEELSVQRFLEQEVERQRKEGQGSSVQQGGPGEIGDAFVEGHHTFPVGREAEMTDMPESEVLEPAGEKKVKHHATFPVSSTEDGGSKKTTKEWLQRAAEVPLPDSPASREVTPRGRRQLSWAEVAGDRV